MFYDHKYTSRYMRWYLQCASVCIASSFRYTCTCMYVAMPMDMYMHVRSYVLGHVHAPSLVLARVVFRESTFFEGAVLFNLLVMVWPAERERMGERRREIERWEGTGREHSNNIIYYVRNSLKCSCHIKHRLMDPMLTVLSGHLLYIVACVQ